MLYESLTSGGSPLSLPPTKWEPWEAGPQARPQLPHPSTCLLHAALLAVFKAKAPGPNAGLPLSPGLVCFSPGIP